MTNRIACGILALTLASCAGAQSGLPPPAASDTAPAASAKRERARLELRVKIPIRRGKRTRYISPSTKSVSIAEGAFKAKTFDTTPSSPNCKTSSGALMCSFTFGLQPGKNVPFLVTTYDKVNGGGSTLSTGRVAQTIVAGLNVVPVTLSGVVSRIDVILQNPNPPAGTAAKLPIVVLARDPDGNIIIGPASYVSPITLTTSDTSGTFALSATRVTSPAAAVTLSYNGGSLTTATIGASAPNVAAANVVPATVAPRPVALNDFILPVGSFTGNSIEGTAIAAGADGNLWIGVCCGTDSGILVMHPGTGAIVHYFTHGKAPSTNLPQLNANGMLEGPNGAVWYASGANVGYISTAGLATNFSVSAACAGAQAQRFARDAAGTGMWVTIACNAGSKIAHVTPAGAITYYGNSLMSSVDGIILGKDGNLYVAGLDAATNVGAIVQATVAGGAITATAILDAQSATELFGIAQTPDGVIWATDANCGDSFPLVQLNLVTPFTASQVDANGIGPNCIAPAFLTKLPDGTLWIPTSGFALAIRAISAGKFAFPTVFNLPLPAPVGASEWDAAVGADGKVYILDRAYTATSSSDVAEVAN